MRTGYLALSLLISLPVTVSAWADEPRITHGQVSCSPAKVCRFSVTVRHGDEGWHHYVDRWDVLGPTGAVLGSRVLLHPHVQEQPFTRSLSGVTIPTNISRVQIRVHDSLHGDGSKTFGVVIPR